MKPLVDTPKQERPKTADSGAQTPPESRPKTAEAGSQTRVDARKEARLAAEETAEAAAEQAEQAAAAAVAKSRRCSSVVAESRRISEAGVEVVDSCTGASRPESIEGDDSPTCYNCGKNYCEVVNEVRYPTKPHLSWMQSAMHLQLSNHELGFGLMTQSDHGLNP